LLDFRDCIMSKNWSNTEVKEIVRDYFDMLSKEIRQIPYNKTSHRKKLRLRLNSRSDGSIEYKHQNISAILINYGRPYIIGYKPRANYQKSLEEAVLSYLQNYDHLDEDFDAFASEATPVESNIDFNNWVKEVPELLVFNEKKVEYIPKLSKVNYIEKEQSNALLGERGEALVLEYEKWSLIKAGKHALADKVEWISRDYGDGAGFDILSRKLDGTDKYIEVKTTKLGKYTPIYLTRNELTFSNNNAANYHLYRVFEFQKAPKMFNALGSLDNICRLEALNFIGKFK